MYRLHGELGFKLIASGPNRTDDPAMAKKHKLQTVPECPRQKRLPNGDRLHILHPDSIEHYFQGVTGFLDHPDANLMWGIFAGDEDDDVAVYRRQCSNVSPPGHTYIHEFDRQVREHSAVANGESRPASRTVIPIRSAGSPCIVSWPTGYGSTTQAVQLVKGGKPRICRHFRSIPWGVYPTEWSLLAPYADLFTLQWVPGGSTRWRPTAGFHRSSSAT
ncbi:MAG: hypothetical protein Ct9H300mP1_17640 [Planctomycetaceae bacterium]|nr:MAG: hypothetical protein Ct9H300mP1_17640 [Planctomycetaceae bacterium]